MIVHEEFRWLSPSMTMLMMLIMAIFWYSNGTRFGIHNAELLPLNNRYFNFNDQHTHNTIATMTADGGRDSDGDGVMAASRACSKSILIFKIQSQHASSRHRTPHICASYTLRSRRHFNISDWENARRARISACCVRCACTHRCIHL